MKYTVCYEMYCSCEVEAENTDDAIKKAIDPKSYHDMVKDVDDVNVTAVFDESGKKVFY